MMNNTQYWFVVIALFTGVGIGVVVTVLLLDSEVRRKAKIAAEILKYHFDVCPKAPIYGEEQKREMRKKAAAIVAGRDNDF